MARMPTATWLGEHAPIQEDGKRLTMTRYDVLCFHTIVGFAPAHAAHFSVRADGTILQSRDTAFRSGANLNGNHRVIAIEVEDHGVAFGQWDTKDGHAVPAFTAEEIEALAQIIVWAHRMHDIPVQPCPDSKPTSRGVAYHRQGIDGNFAGSGYAFPGRVEGGENWSTSFGKVCPGDRRIAQIPQIIARARELLAPPSRRHVTANIKSNPLMPLGDAAADIIQVAGHAGVIGWQEIHKLYRPTIRTLPGFTTYWPGKAFSRAGDAIPISWRTANLELVASGVKRTHLGIPRVTPTRYISWVVLRDLRSGQVFWRVNTHYVSSAFTRHRSRRPMWERHDRKLGNVVLRLVWQHGPNGVVGGDFNRELGSARLNAMLSTHGGQHVGHHYDHLYVFGGEAGLMARLPLNSDHDGILARATFTTEES